MTREEAINILWMYDVNFEPHPAEEVMHAIDMAIEALRQPEIVRCKDCRWHKTDINQCGRQICAVMYDDDYCSYAEQKGGDTDE